MERFQTLLSKKSGGKGAKRKEKGAFAEKRLLGRSPHAVFITKEKDSYEGETRIGLDGHVTGASRWGGNRRGGVARGGNVWEKVAEKEEVGGGRAALWSGCSTEDTLRPPRSRSTMEEKKESGGAG